MKVFFPATMANRYLAVFSSVDDAVDDAIKQSIGLSEPMYIILSQNLFFVDSRLALREVDQLHAIYKNGESVELRDE